MLKNIYLLAEHPVLSAVGSGSMEKWWGTTGCDVDGWGKRSLKGMSKSGAEAAHQPSELSLSKILFWWSCRMVQALQLPSG